MILGRTVDTAMADLAADDTDALTPLDWLLRSAVAVLNGLVGGSITEAGTVTITAPVDIVPGATAEERADAVYEAFEYYFEHQRENLVLLGTFADGPDPTVIVKPTIQIVSADARIDVVIAVPPGFVGKPVVFFGSLSKLRLLTHAVPLSVGEFAAAFKSQDSIRWTFQDKVELATGKDLIFIPIAYVEETTIVESWQDVAPPYRLLGGLDLSSELRYSEWKGPENAIDVDKAAKESRHYGSQFWNRAVFRSAEPTPGFGALVFGIHDKGWDVGHGATFGSAQSERELHTWAVDLGEALDVWLWGLFPPVDDGAVSIRTWWSSAERTGIVVVTFDLMRSNCLLPVISKGDTSAYHDSLLPRLVENGVLALDNVIRRGPPPASLPSLPPLAIFDRVRPRSAGLAMIQSGMVERYGSRRVVVTVRSSPAATDATNAYLGVHDGVVRLELAGSGLQPADALSAIDWFLQTGVLVVLIVGDTAKTTERFLGQVWTAMRCLDERLTGSNVDTVIVFDGDKGCKAALAIARHIPWRVIDCISVSHLVDVTDDDGAAPLPADPLTAVGPFRILQQRDFDAPANPINYAELAVQVMGQQVLPWHGGPDVLVHRAVTDSVLEAVGSGGGFVVVEVTSRGCGATVALFQVAYRLLDSHDAVVCIMNNDWTPADVAGLAEALCLGSVAVVAEGMSVGSARRLWDLLRFHLNSLCSVVVFGSGGLSQPSTIVMSPELTHGEVVALGALLHRLYPTSSAIDEFVAVASEPDPAGDARHMLDGLLSAFTGRLQSLQSFVDQLSEANARIRGLAAMNLCDGRVFRRAAVSTVAVRALLYSLGAAAPIAVIEKEDFIRLVHPDVADALIWGGTGVLASWRTGMVLVEDVFAERPGAVDVVRLTNAFCPTDGAVFAPLVAECIVDDDLHETLRNFTQVSDGVLSIMRRADLGGSEVDLFEFACRLITIKLHCHAGDLKEALELSDAAVRWAYILADEVSHVENVVLKAVSSRASVRVKIAKETRDDEDYNRAVGALIDLQSLEEEHAGDNTAAGHLAAFV